MDTPTELTLIGFGAKTESMEFREYYATNRRRVYQYCEGAWGGGWGNITTQKMLEHLDSLREVVLLKGYEAGLPVMFQNAMAMVVPGLSHCIVADHLPIIAQYYTTLASCPMPTPPDDLHVIYKDHIDLIGMHRTKIIVDEEDSCREYWTLPSVELRLEYSGIGENTGTGLWAQDLGDSMHDCSTFYNILLTTHRAQLLGLPTRPC